MKFRKISVLAAFVFALALSVPLISPGAARADDDRQVVRDTEGQVVHDASTGTCVRTKWENGSDVCGSEHTLISKEDRTVYFKFDSAELTAESRIKLNSLASRIKSESDIKGAEVAGYADRIGTVSYNDKLSKKRAEVVRNYLVAHDIVNTSVTKTRWFGKSEPSAHCPPKLARPKLIECLQPDRKVQVDIVYQEETK